MYSLESTTIEAGLAVAEPLDDRRPGSKASARRFHDAASPDEPVRHMLRAIATDPGEALDRKQWLARVRPLVDRSHTMLRARFEADGSAEAFLRGRARLADAVVVGLLHLARAVVRSDGVVTAIAPVTALAVGGYGRRELAPASDLDLLFLLGDSTGRSHAERLIGFVLTGLWDLGFEVGHASCTAAECMELARVNHVVLASLLDARFLTGSFGVHALLEGNIRQTAKEVGATAVAAALAPPLHREARLQTTRKSRTSNAALVRFATSRPCCGSTGSTMAARTRVRGASLRGWKSRCPRLRPMHAAFCGRSAVTCTCWPAGPRIDSPVIARPRSGRGDPHEAAMAWIASPLRGLAMTYESSECVVAPVLRVTLVTEFVDWRKTPET